jgi:PAS domain S-box-containing protein
MEEQDRYRLDEGREHERVEEELRLLHTLALAVGEAEDVASALDVVLRGVCAATGWTIGQVWLPDARGTALECSSAYYCCAHGLDAFRRASEGLVLLPGTGLPGRAWATGEPVQSRDVTEDPRVVRVRADVARQVGLKAGMAIPVLAGHDVVAVLEFFVCDQREEDDRLVALVATVAVQLGTVIRRKQAEEALRRSEARYRAVVDTAHDAFITMTAEGLVESFNCGAERIFGYRAEEVIGQPLTRLMPERFHAPHTAGLRRYVDTGEGTILRRTLEVAGLHKDGAECPLELTVTTVQEETGHLFAGILRDITERKRLEAERETLLALEQEQTGRLRELAALKADFTALIAHELGGPLAAMRRLIDMLATGELSPAGQAQAVAALRSEAHTLTALVADVQATATVERNDFAVQIRPVPVRTLLAAAAAFADTLPGDHPLTTTSTTDEGVWADAERIGQVLRNLLSNAAKYSPAGAPIELRATRRGERVRIAVADQGYGIHPADMARIFAKFGRGRDQAERKVRGAGLGLYLSERILHAHGGELTVDSTPCTGSVFGFDLQVVQ